MKDYEYETRESLLKRLAEAEARVKKEREESAESLIKELVEALAQVIENEVQLEDHMPHQVFTQARAALLKAGGR